ncbi:Acetylornithine aminotransferase [Planctomycetes bacterium Poly30]|uniref:Acetylornithine aminotransferase n=1 Tax=Saltatorellus ferox TaxID=2528018 RepID=A0A518EYQ3_9BACT|nr:Acetylornithine aminotransferase [Planctomycetes bacterium Poly30]
MAPETTTPSVDRTMGTYRRAHPLFVSGKGAWLFDSEGNRYLDFISGIGAACLGHGHPALAKALGEQAATLGHISNLYRNAPGEAFAARLCEAAGMDAVFFSNSGSEANEGALKLARKYHLAKGEPGRQSFVALKGGFHGRTFGSLSVTSKAAYREPFGAMLEVEFVDPGDHEALAAALAKRPAALILEPIQGEGGILELCDGFLRKARALCTETGTVLIHDEVQCGGGRTGTFLASMRAGDDAKPDVVTLAKPIGAGVPIGAMLARGEMAKTLQPGEHGSTFGGGTLACRAGLVVLDELEAGLQDHVIEIGHAFGKGLDDLVARHDVLAVRRGRGVIQGVVAPGRSSDIVDGLFRAGVLAVTAAQDVVRFLPPYILTADELAEGIERFDRLLTDFF